jgi:transcriptional regulator with GAF, ATPase, and Fis domain
VERDSPGTADSLSAARDQFERHHIRGVLNRVHGNRAEAAKILGVSPAVLTEKCRRYGLPDAGEPDAD